MEVHNIKLYIDGRWQLTDLNVFTRVYIQVYGLVYSLNVADEYLEEEITYIYKMYPWRGGYSAVNFYRKLFNNIPQEFKPQIKSIQYASPGYIELSQLVEVAKDLAQIVGCVSAAILTVDKTYSSICRGIKERKLSEINLRSAELALREKEIDFIQNSVRNIAGVMGITSKTLSKLNFRTENNQLADLKILLSLYRRARDLAKLQNSGKLDMEKSHTKKNKKNEK